MIRRGLVVTMPVSQASYRRFKSPMDPYLRIDSVALYKCTALWSAIYGASELIDPFELFVNGK